MKGVYLLSGNNFSIGFGSSSSRFPRKKEDSTPGPGHYNPKSISRKVPGGAFSKAERFDSR
ncbi:hypothetical protein DID80_07590 [Candidatus Marinamargulisbacteria bacterium SCGC AAA071-K20]|nr:hypothetical protein DID80_07590 [Candidatus Marinamargulisbacteria bacterium SCGC AAA071-K20]